ncbi:MAG: hypothetical protein IJU76_06625 [Desulfovibrionaceae bacterium]|nr:hypothetical protein [Desulfovibrionaceae bacterium]
MKNIVFKALAVLMVLIASHASSLAADCPFGSAVIEAKEAYADKLGFNMHEGPIEPIPVWNYQCVRYDNIKKKWLGYRGSHAYVFPAHMVRVWTADGELIPDGKGNVLIKPRGPVVVWEGESLVGEHVDTITYDAKENSWRTTCQDPNTGKFIENEYPADEFDAYDKNGKLIQRK